MALQTMHLPELLHQPGLVASLSLNGSLARSTATGTLTRQPQKALTGASAAPSGVLTSLKVHTQALAGTLSLVSGTVAKQVSYSVAGTLSTLSGAITPLLKSVHNPVLVAQAIAKLPQKVFGITRNPRSNG